MPQIDKPIVARPAVDLSATTFVPRDVPTKKEWTALVDYVEAHGEKRRANHKDFNSVDFVAGAMTMWFALGWHGHLPAGWVMAPLSGADPLDGKAFQHRPTTSDLLELIKELRHLVTICDAAAATGYEEEFLAADGNYWMALAETTLAQAEGRQP